MSYRDDWISLITEYNDLFGSDHCGYWLRGVARDESGWLVWEDDEKHVHGQEPDRDLALMSWDKRVSLPPGWYYLNRETANRSYDLGALKWGDRWYEEADSDDYDVVIQLALLGEVRYS